MLDQAQVIFQWLLLNKVVLLIKKIRQIELSEFSLTSEQSSILHIIEDRSTMSVREVRDFTMRQPHTTYTILNRMIKMRLLKKMKSKERKGARISLTRKGYNFLSKINVDSLEKTFSAIKMEERRKLLTYLNSLLKKARSLIEISNRPPFLQYIDSDISIDAILDYQKADREAYYFRMWSLLVTTEFAISRLLELELAQFGFTVEQTLILHILKNYPLVSIKELQELTTRQHNSVSILTNRMIKMGLLKKGKSTEWRGAKISLTEKGEKELSRTTTGSLEITFSVLTTEERRQLLTYLNSLLIKALNLLETPTRPHFHE
jgi:DNA-binding MarR family transcriptional regulator